MIKAIRNVFSGVQIAIYMTVILIGSFAYLFLTTRDVIVSLIVGIVAMLFGFYHSVYLPKKLEREQFLLKELQKYTTSMTFYMQSGYNVLQSLDRSRKNLDEAIRRDIEKTMIKLQEEAILDTSHFEKYEFSSLNIFHQILKIKYDVGGDTKELFSKVNESINFEMIKRDELFRKKKYMKMRILLMMGITLSMPLILLFFARDLYNDFLSIGIFATSLNVGLFLAILVSLFFLQRTTTDISIH